LTDGRSASSPIQCREWCLVTVETTRCRDHGKFDVSMLGFRGPTEGEMSLWLVVRIAWLVVGEKQRFSLFSVWTLGSIVLTDRFAHRPLVMGGVH
jgi:hypothetical protein